MLGTSTHRGRRGFTLFECAAAALVGAALVATVQPVFDGVRRSTRAQTSADNLRFWGVASGTYINDYGGLLPAYSWRDGECHVVAGHLGQEDGAVRCVPEDAPGGFIWEVEATRLQELDILRRLSGRVVGDRKIRLANVGMPHRRRSHLVMADHFGIDLGSRRIVDPSDRLQLVWQRDPIAFEDGGAYPSLPGYPIYDGTGPNDGKVQRWAYSSSYRLVPASYSADSGDPQTGLTLSLAGSPNIFSVGDLPLGGRRASDVAFPGQKVFMFEWFDRRSGPVDLWYAFDAAKPNKLMFDGSVNARPTGEALIGADPNEPGEGYDFMNIYDPFTHEPDPDMVPDEFTPVRYRFTRHGLAGIDYTP